MGHKKIKNKRLRKNSHIKNELIIAHLNINEVKEEPRSVSRFELQKKYEENQSYKHKLSLVPEEKNTEDDPVEIEDTLDRRSNTYITSGPMMANFRNIKGPGSDLW
ncbi:MAG: hypothetical protein QG674_42 [Patescibacteria group bacterium]|jgi:hypothetical protein|nr:hypothetical protein [Patescibacteria group bacterium]